MNNYLQGAVEELINSISNQILEENNMKQLITQCSYCKKYQHGKVWVKLDDNTNLLPKLFEITHGICSACMKKQLKEIEKL